MIFLVTSALAYWITGYAFAFGGQPNVILGTRYWASENFGAPNRYPGIDNYTNSNNIYKLNHQDPYIHFFYHYMLAFLVTNIASSSFAERCRVPVYVLFSLLMSGRVKDLLIDWSNLIGFWLGFIYPFLSHWMWAANGWLGAIVGARVGWRLNEWTDVIVRSFDQYSSRIMEVVQLFT